MPRRPASSAREGDGDTRRGYTFAAVEAIGRALPDVEVTTAWGQPALKVHGNMFVCIASHKSAEPNLNHPCVLVRLRCIRLDSLRDLVVDADRFVDVQMRSKSGTDIRRGAARPSRDRR